MPYPKRAYLVETAGCVPPYATHHKGGWRQKLCQNDIYHKKTCQKKKGNSSGKAAGHAIRACHKNITRKSKGGVAKITTGKGHNKQALQNTCRDTKKKKPVRIITSRNGSSTDGCPVCGRAFYEKVNFCMECGTPIDWG